MEKNTNFNTLLEQLKLTANEHDYNQLLSQLTPELSKPQRFLLKMELSRLAKPCTRILDYRNKTQDTTNEVEINKITHHLTTSAISLLEQQIQLFGNYTIGAFEAVEQLMLAEKLSQQGTDSSQQSTISYDKEKHFKAPYIAFDDYIRRSEERMNFSIDLELVTESESGIPAISSDISLNGLRLKLSNNYKMLEGRKIFVLFKGLEKEFALGIKNGVLFTILDVEKNDKHQRLSLERINDNDSQPFDLFLRQFINNNKRRYKVNVDNTIKALRIKGLEQYYTPYTHSLPIYIAKQHGKYTPKYALTNDVNRDILSYWHDEERWLKIEGIFSDERLERHLSLNGNASATFLFCFSFEHKQKTFFYSATLQELQQTPAILSIYMGYGSKRPSWRVYNLQFTPMQPTNAYRPLSLPDNLGDQVAKLNAPLAPRLIKKLQNLSHIAVLTDITDDYCTNAYKAYKVERSDVVKIQPFLHSRTPEYQPISLYRYAYQELRSEQRFHYRTDVHLVSDELDITGVTDDISMTGLRVQLTSPANFNRRAIVNVSLPQLQQYTKKVKLVSLPYKVMNISTDRTVVHLRGFTGFEEDDSKPMSTSRRFFSAFIKEFKKDLVSITEQEETPGFGNALRNIYTSHRVNMAIFMSRKGISIQPTAFAKIANSASLKRLFQDQQDGKKYTIKSLCTYNGKANDVLPSAIKALNNTQTSVMLEALVSRYSDGDRIVTNCIYSHQLDTDAERRAFVDKAVNDGEFIGLKLFVSKLGKIDTDLIATELKYVSIYASHKASELESDLESVTAMIDVLEITDEVRMRYTSLNTR